MIGLTRIALATQLLVLFAGCLAAADPPAAQLISDAGSEASLLKSDLETIEFIGSSQGSWQSHSAIVIAYKGHISALRSAAAKLDAVRTSASPAQAAAIERIVPLMHAFAATADAMIGTIDKNPGRLAGSDYQQYIKVNSSLAADFSTLIGAWAIYGKTAAELALVAEKIGAPVPPLR